MRTQELRNTRGFTLIELLTVVVIIGILTSIAYHYFNSAKDAAHKAQMLSDLRNVVTAQEAYHIGKGKYASALPMLDEYFTGTSQVILIMVGKPEGFTARAQHKTRADIRCAVYIGTINPVFTPAVEEGQIECTPKKGGGKGKGKK